MDTSSGTIVVRFVDYPFAGSSEDLNEQFESLFRSIACEPWRDAVKAGTGISTSVESVQTKIDGLTAERLYTHIGLQDAHREWASAQEFAEWIEESFTETTMTGEVRIGFANNAVNNNASNAGEVETLARALLRDNLLRDNQPLWDAILNGGISVEDFERQNSEPKVALVKVTLDDSFYVTYDEDHPIPNGTGGKSDRLGMWAIIHRANPMVEIVEEDTGYDQGSFSMENLPYFTESVVEDGEDE